MADSPAGWYPQQDGRQRYWDGEKWTEHFAPGTLQGASASGPAAAVPAGTDPQPATATNGGGPVGFVKRHKIVSGVVGGVLLLGMVGALSGGGDDATTIATVAEKESASPSSDASSTPTPTKTFTMPSDDEIAAALESAWKESMLEDTSAAKVALGNTLSERFGGGDFDNNVETYVEGKVAEKNAADALAAAQALAKAAKAAKAPTEREWAKVVKDPDAYTDKYYVVYGEITQFDAATGTDTFRADVAHKNTTEYGFFDGDNCILTGMEELLSDYVEGDVFKATIRVDSAFSYDTSIGGNMTVPLLEVINIKRVGHND